MKVVVLKGGLSNEREVSLRSGAAIEAALKRKGHEVIDVDAGLDLAARLNAIKPESVFIALHGKWGEDGCTQGLLECLGMPYTGSSVRASSLCFDKRVTKDLFQVHGIKTPLHELCHRTDNLDDWCAKLKLALPLIVKPNTEGSSIGVSRVQKLEELKPALVEALKLDTVVLVEQMICGREVTVSVLNGRALPVIEVVPKDGFYDFKSKYTKGMTEYKVPALLSPSLEKKLQEESEKIFLRLDCEGAVRIDYMIDESETPYALEVNTVPGMTETSLLPKAAAFAGISFDDLCEQILQGARVKVTK